MRGGLRATTGAGSVQVWRLDSGGREVFLASGAGNILLDGRVGDLTARSGGGSITLNRVACVGGLADLHVGAGSIVAALAETPRKRLRAEAGVGSVKVSLPKSRAVRVTSRSDRRRKSGRVGEFVAGTIGDRTEFRFSTGVGSVTML